MRNTSFNKGGNAMNVIRSIGAAFSMFSSVPLPHIKWDEGSMRYMLCAFPLIGALIGAMLCAWTWIAGIMGLGRVLYAAGMTIIPIAVTGGIHLDGLCDTADALASFSEPEKRREILKDPHAGAFAVIAVCAYFILYFALATELPRSIWSSAALGLGCMLSRTLSGISVICFPASAGKGLLVFFKEHSSKKKAAAILIAEFIICAAAMILFFRYCGTFMTIAAILCLIYLRLMSQRKFGGMSGDLAGWFLQTAELIMLSVLIITYRVVSA